MNKSSKPNLTYFGYQAVTIAEKVKKVDAVFSSVAPNYDVMNDLMSFGIHRLWKRMAILASQVKAGQTVLDLAGGTGDLSYHFNKLVGPKGHVYLVDINERMIQQGRARLLDDGIVQNITYINADAEQLPLQTSSVDRVCMGFGLRNVAHLDNALREIWRVLKPGGTVVILEFSKPILPWLQTIYEAYSFSLIPWLGELIAEDKNSYQYLIESIQMHPDQATLKSLMESAGLEKCSYFNLCGGIVAIHRGYKF